ncbi:hypothetical protein D4764_05G0001430 [Takifugu flavidus]|uniref:Uncharacterized protein n=1 Tax=Takifugu flavidus TaxID=433684 RepID=A0A5C6MYJ5_9TELE|nr:hypothetical protein D4764_05G0001430 [Takifugu flavidus]
MYAKGKSSNVPSDSQAREKSTAGDQRVGEMEGNYRPKERRRRRRRRRGGGGGGKGSGTEGICWIISLQCCSIDLRMDPCCRGSGTSPM